MCRVAVEVGGFHMVWAGQVEHDAAKTIRPVAFAGHEDGYVATMKLTWADTERGRGPAGTAVRTKRPVLVNDLANDPAFAPWSAAARERGYAANVALPLVAAGDCLGVIGLFSATAGGLDTAAVDLLERLADNVAFGMSALRARSAAAQAQARMSDMIERVTDGFVSFDRDLRILYINEQGAKITGLRPAEIVGRALDEVLPQEDTRPMREACRRAVEQREPLLFEYYSRAMNRGFELRAYPSGDGLSVYFREVTEEWVLQRRLSEVETSLAQAVDISGVGMWRLDLPRSAADAVADGVFEASPSMLRLAGFEPSAHPTLRDWAARVHPEDFARMRSHYGPTLVESLTRDAPSDRMSYRLIRPDGTVRWLEEARRLAFDDLGKPVRLQGVALDVTDRMHEREMLRALADRLQVVREEEKARIARDLHDDLGQLLTAVKMDLRRLERRLGAGAEPRVQAATLDDTITLLDQMVVTVRRIAADLRPAALDKLGLATALEQEARLLRERVGVGCAVEVSGPLPELPFEIATTLYRVAQESLTNVARHAHARQVRVSLGASGGAVTLAIEDDGRGIEEPHRAAGLGLLGMRERATMLGGSLAVERRVEGGTRVSCRIPMPAPTLAPAPLAGAGV
jgi:PAS domain S-box-containing protein